MKKQDLTTGVVVEHRNGAKGIVLLGAKLFATTSADIIVDLESGNYLNLSVYADNLILPSDNEWDIMKACDMRYTGDNIRAHVIDETDSWTWRREGVSMFALEELFKERGFEIDQSRSHIYIQTDDENICASIEKDTLQVDFDWRAYDRADAEGRIKIMSLVGEVLLVLEQS